MEKIQKTSSDLNNDARIFDFSKMISSNYSQKGGDSFKRVISLHSSQKTSEKYEPKKVTTPPKDKKDSVRADFSKDDKIVKSQDKSGKKTEIKEDKNIKDINDKSVQKENKKDPNQTQKVDEKIGQKLDNNIEKDTKDDSLQMEDMIYISAGFIDAFKNLKNLQESGVVITEEKIKEIFQDVEAVDLSGIFMNLKNQGLTDEQIKAIHQNLDVINQDSQELDVANTLVMSDDELAEDIKSLFLSLTENSEATTQNTQKTDVEFYKNGQSLNLDEEIQNLKQDITDQNTKVINPAHENFNSELNQDLENHDLDIMEDYSNYTVKITGNHAKINEQARMNVNPEQQIQNFSKIIDEINVAYRTDKNTINIKLEPETLGQLTVKIQSENGVIQASFIVENERAKRALEEQIQQLKDTLVQQGVNVSDINVQVGHNQEDYDLHRNIMEASHYSSNLDFEDDGSFEEELVDQNPYLEDDLFNDIV